MSRRPVLLLVTLAVCAVAAAALVPVLSAQSADGALANFAPGKVKLLHTGGTAPNSQYALLDRLTLPVGSWAILAHTVLVSQASSSTGVDCFLVVPNSAPAYTPTELPNTKGGNIKELSLDAVINAPNGGPADLLCRLSNVTADRHVFAQDTSIVAVSVTGATVTNTPPPPLGSY